MVSDGARVLILGSMPGKLSLQQERYYAHPRNAFWPLIGGMLGFDTDTPYRQKLAMLIRHRIALWDVLQSCYRPGSLDTSIQGDSVVVNDFSTFFRRHHGIRAVFFNGATAERLYRKHVMPSLNAEQNTVFLHRLPSTSPANARLTLQEKLHQWRLIRDYINGGE